MNFLQNPAAWIFLALVAAVGLAVGWHLGRRRPAGSAPEHQGPTVPLAVGERHLRRAGSFDAISDAVLITDVEGKVLDCNGSALTLFDRHRSAVEEQPVTMLRKVDGPDQSEPRRIAAERSVWVGSAWARQPDGALRLCHMRVVALRDERARVTGFTESYRELLQNRNDDRELRELLYGARGLGDAGMSTGDALTAIQDDLRMLSEGFRDLDHVLRQYERLLPALSAYDPVAEAIAGLAHDTQAAVTSVGVPALLEEIPRTLARLRAHMQLMAAGQSPSQGADPLPAAPERLPETPQA